MNVKPAAFSDEYLNAYLDGELDGDDRERLMEALERDPSLGQRLCELRNLSDLVRLGYREPPASKHAARPRGGNGGAWRSLAASLLVAVGAAAGWLGHGMMEPGQGLTAIARTVELAQERRSEDGPVRIMLHVTTADRGKLDTLLEEAEQLLAAYQGREGNQQVAILATGAGLNLLRADTSAYAQRLEDLKGRYANLSLLACAKALARAGQAQGHTPPLLPRIEVVPSALGEIIDRRKNGWSYIRI